MSKSDAADLVHKQWGHLAQPRIERNIASGHIPWTHDSSATKFTHCTEPCVVCQLAKSQRRTFTRPLHSVATPGQHVYVDMYGPVDTPSLIDGHTYAVGIIDAFSSYL